MAPNFANSLNDSVTELEQRILDSMPAIERWFRLEWMEHTPTFYSAVELRDAAYKLSPVELDLYPGQWHRLSPASLPLAVQAAMAGIEKICPEARNLMLIPDYRLNDIGYQQSVAQLLRIFHSAGLNVRVGSIDPSVTTSREWTLPGGGHFIVEPVERVGQRLKLRHFDACTLLLNHDLSQGVPGIMEDLTGQYLLPPLHATLASRHRGEFCQTYEEVSKRFAKLLGIDPWLIAPMHQITSAFGITDSQSSQQLVDQVDDLLQKIKRKYRDYSIDDKPFVRVQTHHVDSAGAHPHDPVAVTVHSAQQMAQFIAKAKAKATGDAWSVYEGRWLVQEGVHSHAADGAGASQPVVYMMDRYVVGSLYRPQVASSDDMSVLNVANPETLEGKSRFYAYGVIARLAMLAASYQMEAIDPAAELYD